MHQASSLARGIGVAAAIATFGFAWACASDSMAPADAAAQLSFSTATSSATLDAVPITNGGHTLDLTAVSLVVSRAELKPVKSAACLGDDDEDDEDDDHAAPVGTPVNCGELKVGPTTVALPLNGTLTSLPANAIPAGSYRELELRVSQVELKGTYDGAPFDVILPVKLKSEIDFTTPLVVTAGSPTAITVNVPVNTWLVNSDGSLVNPNQILTSSTLMSRVKSRIAASFRAFKDRDHDGREDHDD